MRHLLASAVAALVLFVSASALAVPAGQDGAGAGAGAGDGAAVVLGIGRCVEQPMSLAMRIAEAESSRALPEAALASTADAVLATPAERAANANRAADGVNGNANANANAPRPVSMPPRACNSPDDPGCQVSAPVQQPTHVHTGHVDHGFALAPLAPPLPPVAIAVLSWPPAASRPLADHAHGLFRPPRR